MSTRARGWVVPVVVAVVAAIIGAGTVILFVDPGSAAGASIALEPATTAGTDPFTRSVTSGNIPETIAPVTRTVAATLTTDTTTGGLTATGKTPGLYGGTGNTGVCDPDQLSDYLTHTPDKAAAWATTLGVTPRAIPAYIATLTPVVLTTDTRVTNHGYANGTATPRQSILQAGTAVLVDHFGIPRVKCGCGNPLTEPTSQPIDTTTGTPWTGYQPQTVTTITPTATRQTTFTLTNITTGTTYPQTAGTRGTNSTSNGTTGTLVAFAQVVQQGEDPLEPRPFVVSHDHGVTWSPMAGTRPTSVGGIAFGRGIDVAVADDQVLVSKSGGAWSRVATLEPTLVDVAFGNGEFVAVARGAGAGPTGTVYTSPDGKTWQQAGSIPAPAGYASISPIAIAYGNGTWAILAQETPTDAGQPTTVILSSSDTRTWTSASGYRYENLRFGGGEWFGFDAAPGIDGPDYTHVQIVSSRDLSAWSDAGESPAGASPYTATYVDGRWYLAAVDGENLGLLLYSSSDQGLHWQPVTTGERYPLLALAPGP